MHHKRKRAKNRRAGCLMCKPWKINGAKHRKENRKRQVRRADQAMRWEMKTQEVAHA